MKRALHTILTAAALLAFIGCTGTPAIIFDTDLGNDNDDAMALDMLHKYVDAGKIELLAVMCSKNTDASATLVDIFDTWYGHPEIPIGKVVDGADIVNPYEYEERICNLTIGGGRPMFSPTAGSPDEYEEATALYRKTLASQRNKSVTIVCVGYLTNLARLLESGPDEYSRLSGVDLVRKKVKEISLMGGDFSEGHGPEFNINCDIPSAKKVFELCPVPVVISPFHLGLKALYPCSSILGDFDWGVSHPMVETYVRYSPMPYDKCTFDLTSVLYAVEPEYFTVGERGTVTVNDDSSVDFTPSEDGLCRILSVDEVQQKVMIDRLVEIITTRPACIPDPKETLAPTSFTHLMETAPKDSIDAWYACSSRIDPEEALAHGAEIRKAKKLICFDLDATLCPHRLPVPEANKAVLDTICKLYDVVMVGAGNAPRIHRQMDGYPLDVVGNYGMEEYRMLDGQFTIVKQLRFPADTARFTATCQMLREKHGYTEYSGAPLEFHASGMVTFGLLGTTPDPQAKLVFDPDRAKRRAFYPEVVSLFPDHNVFIGGSTSFDFVLKMFNKYDATLKYALSRGYSKEEVLFVGDDFDDGGGDSHIRLGGIDYVHITDYNELPQKLAFLYRQD
ncbi:MAG: nucleoside hydrolase [Bacteroidales bacterium]|nr:nucleoside hydrolase [Candidatus Cryptobacteroides faecihippi]